MKNKNKNRESDKWYMTFDNLDFSDSELVKVLEDMLDSEILKYAVFQRFSSRNGKEHIYLFMLLNELVDKEILSERFRADNFEIYRGKIDDCRKYIMRKTYYSSIPYEIGSLEEESNNKLEDTTINIKGTIYKVKFKNYLYGSLGITRPISKEILIENTENIDDLKDTIVHELMHAYFCECGLLKYYDDEILVTWLGQHFGEINNQLENLIKGRK